MDQVRTSGGVRPDYYSFVAFGQQKSRGVHSSVITPLETENSERKVETQRKTIEGLQIFHVG